MNRSALSRIGGSSVLAAFLTVLLGAPGAEANVVCQNVPQGRLCTAQIDFQRFAQTAYMQQAMSQWCWAASISMIYSYYGYAVSQPRLVQEVYGGIGNIPAMTGYTIAQQLNRAWIDDRGVPFTSQLTGAYDPQFGVRAIGNAQIVNELANERPLVIGARTHAMILTMVQYLDQPTGPNIVSAGVFDPWPGQGARLLQQDEIVPVEFNGSLRFLAAIRVSASSPPPPPPPPTATPDAGVIVISPGTRTDRDTRSSGFRGTAHPAPAAPSGIVMLLGLVPLLRRRRRADPRRN